MVVFVEHYKMISKIYKKYVILLKKIKKYAIIILLVYKKLN